MQEPAEKYLVDALSEAGASEEEVEATICLGRLLIEDSGYADILITQGHAGLIGGVLLLQPKLHSERRSRFPVVMAFDHGNDGYRFDSVLGAMNSSKVQAPKVTKRDNRRVGRDIYAEETRGAGQEQIQSEWWRDEADYRGFGETGWGKDTGE